MIPKVIHYCWFGGNPLPTFAQKCIDSWKKYCPDYRIKQWDEGNVDLNSCAYIREAFEEKKWAFITDYVRLDVLFAEGGIYMDTDVEVVASLDSFLHHHAFSGFENETQVPTGIMACEKGFPLIQELLDYYKGRHFRLEDGRLDQTTNVYSITEICKRHGLKENNTLQDIDGFVFYPKDYFCPKDYYTGRIQRTKNTRTIHHFSGTWKKWDEKMAAAIKGKTKERGAVVSFFGKVVAFPFSLSSRIRREGFAGAIRHYINKIMHRS